MKTSSNQSPPKSTLTRRTFTTSRLLEYFTEKELVFQTGHSPELWPDVVLKELVDNALDAAEDAGVPPEITISCSAKTLTVTDNGPGLSADVVGRILDFSTKTSSKDYYISPTRGTQGNALKTVLAIPYVLSGCQCGIVEIESQGVRHVITVGVDRLRQEPKLEHVTRRSVVKKGSSIGVMWPEKASLEADSPASGFLQRLRNYAIFNQHATFSFLQGKQQVVLRRASAEWAKWRPNDPTSAHWYTLDQMTSLIGAFVASERDGGQPRFVREFVSEFRGLSGTGKQKAILGVLGLAGTRLDGLVKGGDVDREIVGRLLSAMQEASRPVQPDALGRIGEGHIRSQFKLRGCEENSFRYRRAAGFDNNGRPYLAEIAFAVVADAEREREVITGLNFSPTIGDPFRTLGQQSLGELLGAQYVLEDSPCLVFAHLTAPHLKYSDRGKTAVTL